MHKDLLTHLNNIATGAHAAASYHRPQHAGAAPLQMRGFQGWAHSGWRRPAGMPQVPHAQTMDSGLWTISGSHHTGAFGMLQLGLPAATMHPGHYWGRGY